MFGRVKPSILAAVIILALVSFLLELGSFVRYLPGVPASPDLPLSLRVAGAVAIGAGLLLGLWLFRYRRPGDMLVSTYFTFHKMFTRAPLREPAARTEPLVVRGPQRLLRHPLYLAALLVFFGKGLLTASFATLTGAVLILLWLRLVQIPFEEREMQSLFGDAWAGYRRATPMLLPFRLRQW
jgi:protein-S-isoprenylcysteine O-methyltransferase Ste14